MLQFCVMLDMVTKDGRLCALNALISNAKNVVFDVGQVLLRFVPQDFLPRMFPQDIAEALMPPTLFGGDTWLRMDEGVYHAEEAARIITDKAGRPDLYESELHFMLNFAKCMSLLPAAHLVPELKKMGKKLYIISNYGAETFAATQANFPDLFSQFDGMVISAHEKLLKPDARIYNLLLERYNLKILKLSRREIIKQGYGRRFFELINQTYCNLYGFSLLTDKQIDSYVDLYLSLIDTRMITFVENDKGELVAAGASIPSLSAALQKCNGEIFPFGWWHLLKAMFIKRPDTLDLLLIGVRPDYQNCGVNSVLILDLAERYKQMGFKFAETNAMLESNEKIQAMWRPFDKEQHKARWVFGKEIE